MELARRGWRVAVNARRAEALVELQSAVADPASIIVAPGDVSDRQAFAEVVAGIEARHGPIVLAFLNAGTYLPVRASPFRPEDFDQTFAINVGGVVNGLAALLPIMSARHFGQIAINASVAGYSGLPTSAAYGASKAALIHMAEALKFDLDPLGITMQIVNPGFVATPLTAKNAFPMPFIIKVDKAARRTVDGFERGGFEITYPRRFAYILKALSNLLPYPLYFSLIRAQTGAGTKG